MKKFVNVILCLLVICDGFFNYNIFAIDDGKVVEEGTKSSEEHFLYSDDCDANIKEFKEEFAKKLEDVIVELQIFEYFILKDPVHSRDDKVRNLHERLTLLLDYLRYAKDKDIEYIRSNVDFLFKELESLELERIAKSKLMDIRCVEEYWSLYCNPGEKNITYFVNFLYHILSLFFKDTENLPSVAYMKEYYCIGCQELIDCQEVLDMRMALLLNCPDKRMCGAFCQMSLLMIKDIAKYRGTNRVIRRLMWVV